MAIKIYIDQGHNPVNPNAGAEGNGYREQDLVFEIGRILAAILQRSGFETRLSRPTADTQLGTSVASSLAARVDGANSWGADYFVSLHTNASVNPNANGAEVLVYSTSSPAFELAKSVLEQLTLITGVRGRGVVSRPGLYVLRKTAMPAILIEMGFITNPSDASLMANSPQLFAEGIANGIIDYVRRGEIGASAEVLYRDDEIYEDEMNDSGFAKDDEEDEEEGRYETIEDFMADNNREGLLKIQAFRGQQAIPLEGVSVIISKRIGDTDYIFFEGETNESGIIDGIILPAPPSSNSTEYGKKDRAAFYDVLAEKSRFDPIHRKIEVFSDIRTIQPLQMTQRKGEIYGSALDT